MLHPVCHSPFIPSLLSSSLPTFSPSLLCSVQLLSYGCDPDHVDATGSTAAHQAVGYVARLHGTVEEGEWQMGVAHIAQSITALGEGGASLDVLDPAGNAPIHVRITQHGLSCQFRNCCADIPYVSKSSQSVTLANLMNGAYL